MSNLDTRKTGGGPTVSFATVRLESEHLFPEELVALLTQTADRHTDGDVHIEQQGTGLARH